MGTRRNLKPVSNLTATLSNRVFPIVFFLTLGLIALHYLPSADWVLLKINLGVVSVFSTSMAIYLTVLLI